LKFAWDSAKSSANERDRGFDFAFAASIFGGPHLVTEDGREIAMTRPLRKGDRRPPGRADLPRLRHQSEAEIRRTSPPELKDLPGDFWDGAVLVVPVPKQAISLRVDEDVLAWFRAAGPRYQTRMNAVLRSYMERARHGGRGGG